MGSDMDFKTTRSGVSFAAKRTGMRFITCMYKQVCLQVTFSDKTFATIIVLANKGPFACLKRIN